MFTPIALFGMSLLFQSNLSVTVSVIIGRQETLIGPIDTLKRFYNTTIGTETLEKISLTAPSRCRFAVDLVLAKFDKNDDSFSKKEFYEVPKVITLEELIHNEEYKMSWWSWENIYDENHSYSMGTK